jgi:2-iminobutanoate/2-iminopropanoate deaminase
MKMRKFKKEVIIPSGGAKPLAPYSPGIRLGNLVYTSGQIGIDPTTGKLVTGGVIPETKQALNNLTRILESAGTSLNNVVKVTVYVREIEDYASVNQVYGEYFIENPPARSIIQGELPAGASVVFDAIAYV